MKRHFRNSEVYRLVNKKGLPNVDKASSQNSSHKICCIAHQGVCMMMLALPSKPDLFSPGS